jgi:hypothetical protein
MIGAALETEADGCTGCAKGGPGAAGPGLEFHF